MLTEAELIAIARRDRNALHRGKRPGTPSQAACDRHALLLDRRDLVRENAMLRSHVDSIDRELDQLESALGESLRGASRSGFEAHEPVSTDGVPAEKPPAGEDL